MAGKDVVVGSQPIEYAEESSFATELPEETNWIWPGIVDSWSADQGVESESITYLPEYNADNKLEKRVNVKLREMYSGDLTYHPQGSFDFLKYFTGSIGGTSDDVPSIQFGEINESLNPEEFRRLKGGVGEEVTVSVEEDGVVEVEGSFMFAGANDWKDIDYVGDTGITALASPVSPETDSSVGVTTDTIDTGEVILYDGSDNELARVEASTSYIAADVGGTDVAGVRLVNTDTSVTAETITVDGETDGSGTDSSTADVDSSGTHATEDTTEPWSYDNLSDVTWGGDPMDGSVQSVELSISNEIAEVRDPNVDRGTQLASLVPVDREITVDVDFTYDSFDVLQDVRSYTAKDFKFTIGNTTFTVGDVRFPTAPYEYTADDLVADSLSSDPASSITWTTA
jgi:hypothetical protein